MSSVSTRAFYGAQTAGPDAAGGGAALPLFDCNINGTGDFISDLSELKAKGARAIIKFVGSPSNYRDGNSAFSLPGWQSMMSKAFAKTSPQQMGNFVADGTLLANYLLDDITEGGTVFAGGAPDFVDLETCAQISKSVWTLVPCCVRSGNIYLKSLCVAAGASNYTYVDFGWDNWVRRYGAAEPRFTNHVNDGRSVGLGALVGMNLLNGGSGITAPWNAHPGRSHLFGMSPQEIDAVGAAFSALTSIIGLDVWSQNPTFDPTDYWHWPSIQTALQAYANRAIGRTMGPINWRDVSGQTSGSTQTVAGGWALVQVAGHKRSATVPLSVAIANTPVPGHILLCQAYSRDSIQYSSTTPSGWTLVKQISGNSAQGGDLALYFRTADGQEGVSLSVPFSGSGGEGAVAMATVFEFSGNTTGTGAVLSTIGSAKSWSAGTSAMGPVPGLTSAASDALVLVCAAKANDFTAQNLPDPATLSATTSGGETWNRAFISGSALGNDAGMFCDYTALSGTPSITTKSWSQLTQANSDSSGAGCGFMVSFRPATVVAGQKPLIVDLEDVTISVNSTLSVTFSSDGSTPITWSKTSGPSNVTLDTSTGAFQWTPLVVGQYVHVIGASNSHGTDEVAFEATVVASGNVAPVITHPGDKTVIAQDRLSFAVLSVDSDGDAVEYSLEDPPAGALIVEDSGHFVWTPTGSQGPGTYPVVVLVSDGQHESRSTFTVTVQDTDWTRTITSPTNQFRRI